MAHPRLTSREPRGLTHFDADAALQLVQAFHRELDLEQFLAKLFSQLHALTGARGAHFHYPPTGVDLLLGQRERHSAQYNLEFEGDPLGALTVFFARRANEQEIHTIEDLCGLLMTALRNCLTVLTLQNGARTAIVSDEERDLLESDTHKSDALILVALDDYEAIRSRDGQEWAGTLMSSVHSEILQGLRATDGVYQISEELVAVLLPNTSIKLACDVAEKIRVLIARLHLNVENCDQQLTACMGVTYARHAVTADDVMTNARTALNTAQSAGPDRIEVFPSRNPT